MQHTHPTPPPVATQAQSAPAVHHRVAYLREGDLLIPVEVLDEKRAYGREDLLIRPLGGQGLLWVSARRVLPVLPPEGDTGEGEEFLTIG